MGNFPDKRDGGVMGDGGNCGVASGGILNIVIEGLDRVGADAYVGALIEGERVWLVV